MKNQIEKAEVPQKLVKFVKKNAKLLPHLLTREEGRKLLPELDQISLISKPPAKKSNDTRFHELQNKLSSSMVEFVNTAENEKT